MQHQNAQLICQCHTGRERCSQLSMPTCSLPSSKHCSMGQHIMEALMSSESDISSGVLETAYLDWRRFLRKNSHCSYPTGSPSQDRQSRMRATLAMIGPLARSAATTGRQERRPPLAISNTLCAWGCPGNIPILVDRRPLLDTLEGLLKIRYLSQRQSRYRPTWRPPIAGALKPRSLSVALSPIAIHKIFRVIQKKVRYSDKNNFFTTFGAGNVYHY